MKATVSRKSLSKALEVLSRAKMAYKKSNEIVIVTFPGIVRLIRSDFSVSVAVDVPATVDVHGSGGLLPLRKIRNVLKCMDDPEVVISANEDDGKMESAEFQIGIYVFKDIQSDLFGEKHRVIADVFDGFTAHTITKMPDDMKARVITASKYAASDCSRYGLTRVCLHEISQGHSKWLSPGVRVVATDGHRLFVSKHFETGFSTSGEGNLLLSFIGYQLQMSPAYIPLFKSSKDVFASVQYGEKTDDIVRVLIDYGDIKAMVYDHHDSRGDFPEWLQILPQRREPVSFENPRAFSSRLKAITETSENRSVALRVDGDQISLFTGTSKDDPTGNHLESTFERIAEHAHGMNGDYLTSAIDDIYKLSGSLSIMFPPEDRLMSAVMIGDSELNEFVIVMPMRLM